MRSPSNVCLCQDVCRFLCHSQALSTSSTCRLRHLRRLHDTAIAIATAIATAAVISTSTIATAIASCRRFCVLIYDILWALRSSTYSRPGRGGGVGTFATTHAALIMASATFGTTALPSALIPSREPIGRRQSNGNACRIAVSFTLRHRTVAPSA